MNTRPVLAVILLACLLASACSGGKSSSSATSAPGSSPAATTSPASPGSTDLSLVYVDSSKGNGPEIYVSAFDGSSPRLVKSLPSGSRVLDVANGVLASSLERTVRLLDLKSGATRDVSVPNLLTDGRFVDSNTLVYTTYAGCGPATGSKATVSKLDLRTLQNTELVAPDHRNMNISGVDAGLSQVAITLRGCDVGVQDIAVYSVTDGKGVSTISTRGCGWALTSLALKRAVVSWQYCSPTPDKVGVDISLLKFDSTPPAATDLKGPGGGANFHEFRLRPSKPQAALGSQTAGTPGPGFKPTSTGIWLMDLDSGAFTNLVQSDGLEQYPVAWSTDGRFLLNATVHAQGLCDYSALDVAANKTTPIVKTLTFCGANGDVLGWTVIK